MLQAKFPMQDNKELKHKQTFTFDQKYAGICVENSALQPLLATSETVLLK